MLVVNNFLLGEKVIKDTDSGKSSIINIIDTYNSNTFPFIISELHYFIEFSCSSVKNSEKYNIEISINNNVIVTDQREEIFANSNKAYLTLNIFGIVVESEGFINCKILTPSGEEIRCHTTKVNSLALEKLEIVDKES